MIVRSGENPAGKQQEDSGEWQLWSSFLKDRSWPIDVFRVHQCVGSPWPSSIRLPFRLLDYPHRIMPPFPFLQSQQVIRL